MAARIRQCSHDAAVGVGEDQPMRVVGMKPVGNYAYGIEFSDGHDTGIYTFELLRELGTVA